MPIAETAAAEHRRSPTHLPLVPLPRAGHLSAAAAGRLAKRARHLLRAGDLTHREHALLDALLWSCRQPGHDLATASYSALSKLVRIARGTIADGLAKLEQLGLITRIKRRVRMAWHQGGAASRQTTSCYKLCPPEPDARHTEFSERTVNGGIEILLTEKAPYDDAEAARKTLAAIRKRRAAVLAEEWQRRRAP